MTRPGDGGDAILQILAQKESLAEISDDARSTREREGVAGLGFLCDSREGAGRRVAAGCGCKEWTCSAKRREGKKKRDLSQFVFLLSSSSSSPISWLRGWRAVFRVVRGGRSRLESVQLYTQALHLGNYEQVVFVQLLIFLRWKKRNGHRNRPGKECVEGGEKKNK
jgi:hypothetical protein